MIENVARTQPDESRDGSSLRRFKNSYLKPFMNTDISLRGLPLMQAWSGRPGPTVWLTACAHGDEIGGSIVIQEVFKRLRKHPLVRGDLFALPIMNPIGLEMAVREVPFSGEDLNRSFPGRPDGSLAARMAAKMFTAIEDSRPALVLDLHNDWIHSIPYAVIDPQDPRFDAAAQARTLEVAQRIGFVVVNETTPVEGSLSDCLLARGIPALTVELGESHVVNEKNIARGLAAVWNALDHLGLVDAPGEAFQMDLPARFFGKRLGYVEVRCASSGLVRFHVHPGQTVVKNQVLAKIFNPFGRLQETLRAPSEGLVLGYCDSSFAYPGASVVALARTISPEAGKT